MSILSIIITLFLCDSVVCFALFYLFWFQERKEDDLSDGDIVGKKHDKPVDAYSKAAGRWHAIFQGSQEIFVYLPGNIGLGA